MVRLKTRYVLVEVVVPPASARKLALQKEDVANLIRDSIARNYGDYGVGLLQYAFQGTTVPLHAMAMQSLSRTHLHMRTSQCSITTNTRALQSCAARASSASSSSRRSCL